MNGSPVAGLIRGWVDLYTRGLPADARAARRDEIADDLWCEHAEAAAAGRSARSLDADLFLRLLFGLPADISWRLTHRRAPTPPSLVSSSNTRTLGLLAIFAASSLFTLPILTGGTSDPAWAWVLVPIGSIIAFTAAALGLALQFQDRVGRLGAVGATVVALGSALMFLAYAVGLAMIPLGSAMLMWDLARIGVLSRRASIAHLSSAVTLVVGLAVALLTQGNLALGLVGGVSYLLSWIAIGVSLVRGVPQAQARSG
jgi:hypothetical protein